MITFNIDTTEVIPEILNKYGLEDGNEKMLEEIERGEGATTIIPGEVILDLAIKVIAGEISIKDMPTILINKLQLPKATADLLAKDIQEKIVSNAIKEGGGEAVTSKKIEDKDIDLFPRAKPATNATEQIEKRESQPIKESISRSIHPPKKQEVNKKPTMPEKNKEYVPPIKQSKGPDNYREPIE